ncbi:MAG TPA: carbohydrate kinase [Acidimicrobiales bacterium]|nr:carbohydrate kinase [Acidimicrobiales bacterium]
MSQTVGVGVSETGGVAKALVVGECLVDLAPASAGAPGHGTSRTGKVGAWARQLVAMPGGGPANIAVGLARLGVPTAFAGRFSREGFGPWLHSYLVANGLDLALSVEAGEDATLALVTLDDQGRATYTFYGPGTADWQWEVNELPDLTATGPADLGISAVHTGSIALTLEPGASVLAGWLEGLRRGNRVLVSFDPNMRPSLIRDLSDYRERLPGVISSSHIVKASDEDVEVLYPGATAPEVADRWLSNGVSLVVITEGALGATAFHKNGARAHCAPPPIEVVDTIGAGDSFSAGLLAYFAKNGLLAPAALATISEGHLHDAIDEAVSASAMTCTRPGADPPTEEELARFIAERG